MKKTLLLAAAAIFAASNAFAVDLYVVGGNVNGQDAWSSTANKMTETSTGVFEWQGQVLGSGFKINNGGWDDADYNIGAPEGDTNVTLGTAKAYATGDGSADFTFNNFQVNNPKVVLNMNSKTVTVSGEQGEVVVPDPSEVTFYIIGSNVNGKNWALAEPDCAFTDKGNGIYEWTGTMLGTGFKINDGTWSNEAYNIGSTGAEIYLDTPYYYATGGSSGNISFAGFTELENPKVVLDLNEMSITVSGLGSGEASWYLMGINDNWDFTEEWELKPTEEDGIFSGEYLIVEQAGEFKISDTGWAHELGTNTPDEVYINAESMSITLDDVVGEGGNVSYELVEGTYKVIFDYNEYELTFVDAAGVEHVLIGSEGQPVYYNLHGQKVANPDRGIFVKVVNGNAVKVVL